MPSSVKPLFNRESVVLIFLIHLNVSTVNRTIANLAREASKGVPYTIPCLMSELVSKKI